MRRLFPPVIINRKMPTAIQVFRKHKWRMWLLVFLYTVAMAGAYALRISTEELYCGEVNSPATDVMTIQQNGYAGGESICIRDVKTGRVLLDLAEIGAKRGAVVGWHSQNGNVLAAVSVDSPGKVELIEVQVRPHVDIVRRREFDIANLNLDVVMSNPNGELRCGIVKRHFNMLSRPHFKIVDESGSTVRQIDFGRDESVYLTASADGAIIMVHFQGKGIGDNIFTDGTSNGILHLDAITGETLRQHQGAFVGLWHGEEFIGVPAKGGSCDVVNIERPAESVVRMGRGIPLRIDDDTFATYEHSAMSTLTLHTVGSEQSPHVTKLPTWGEVQPMASATDGKVFLVTNGLLQRMDTHTGGRHQPRLDSTLVQTNTRDLLSRHAALCNRVANILASQHEHAADVGGRVCHVGLHRRTRLLDVDPIRPRIQALDGDGGLRTVGCDGSTCVGLGLDTEVDLGPRRSDRDAIGCRITCLFRCLARWRRSPAFRRRRCGVHRLFFQWLAFSATFVPSRSPQPAC